MIAQLKEALRARLAARDTARSELARLLARLEQVRADEEAAEAERTRATDAAAEQVGPLVAAGSAPDSPQVEALMVGVRESDRRLHGIQVAASAVERLAGSQRASAEQAEREVRGAARQLAGARVAELCQVIARAQRDALAAFDTAIDLGWAVGDPEILVREAWGAVHAAFARSGFDAPEPFRRLDLPRDPPGLAMLLEAPLGGSADDSEPSDERFRTSGVRQPS